VLLPLRDVVPDYRHPVSGLDIDRMIASLPPDQQIRKAD
jgi:2-amino-4-hydroxy-6-hydroxymethyldihydropteridine diphosphokinase